MIAFWIISFIMLAVAVGLITPALLGRRRVEERDQDEQNVRIARERLHELQAELQKGLITGAQFDQSRDELEQALLSDISADTPRQASVQAASGRWAFILVLLLVPGLSGSLYLYLGHPAALLDDNSGGKAQLPADHPTVSRTDRLPTVEEMVASLEARLRQQPDDAQGWFTLGRSYMAMGRYKEAAEALGKLHKLAGDHPSVLLAYADALSMANGGRIAGKPFELFKKALAAKPGDATALWLVGMGYEEQGDYEAAVRHWKQLEPLLVDDAQSLRDVRQLIARAEEKLGRKVAVTGKATPAAGARLTVMVSLDPALQDKTRPTDTVFVFARAMQGPSMPLAVVRKQVQDLPLEVTLDDAMAMMPGMKLSSFDEVMVGARISRSGSAQATSGDLSGEVAAVTVASTSPVRVVINTRQP